MAKLSALMSAPVTLKLLMLSLMMLGVLMALAGCRSSTTDDTPAAVASSGQVNTSSSAQQVSYYAAARFAEQATFGVNLDTINSIRSKGFERWIDEQLALPPTQFDLNIFLGFPDQIPQEQDQYYNRMFVDAAIGATDQLRMRTTWALSQFVVVSSRKTDLVGVAYWKNLMLRKSLGSYADLLYEATISPAMGHFLDNGQNRPKSAQCPSCAPNENYARELMQLFTIGVVALNSDGTIVKDSKGRPVETYTQRDVEELARVLTGWSYNPEPVNRPSRNWANWGKQMVHSTWPPERDSGVKKVLSKTFPAGQSQEKDLRDAVDYLVSHGNTAPFIATRMIQHLVKSNPTPAYVARVAAVFRNNGAGAVGDLKAVVKAVLLDSEARAGDVPGNGRSDDGKVREPLLFHMALWRGLGCARVPSIDGWFRLPDMQRPFNAESVFSFYAPTDRAPGSNLLAPEQRLLTSTEFTDRLSLASAYLWEPGAQGTSLSAYLAAGCQQTKALADAYASSPREYLDLLSALFFRGTMPPTLRVSLERLIAQPQWNANDKLESALRILDFSLTSPSFGVIK